MRISPTALLIAALVPWSATADNFQVQTHKLGPDQYELAVKLPPDVGPAQVQAILRPRAGQVCDGRAWQWGKYRFDSSKPLEAKPPLVGQQTFVQEVLCGAALPVDATAVPAPKTPAGANDIRRVKESTLAYLVAKDNGDFTKVRTMLTKEAEPYMQADWSDQRAAFNQQAGLPTRREVVRLSWYDNPQGAIRLGRYVAADYRGDYKHAGFYCGYVLWYREADGGYRVVREEEGQISNETAKKTAPADLPALRKQVGCRD